MPTLGDFYDRLGEVNTHVADMDTKMSTLDGHVQQTNTELSTVEGTLTSIDSDVRQMDSDLSALLGHIVEQNDTIICILEHISKNTCELVNAAVLELRQLQSVELSARELDSMAKTVHPDAALVLAREEAARVELEKCCPPKHPEPVCRYEPCEKPAKPVKGQTTVAARRR